MDEHELWLKFTKDGKIEDYLEYRRHLEMSAQADLGKVNEIQYGGARDPHTGYW